MSPRNPLQQLQINGCSPRTRTVDLFCYETMPTPEDLFPPVRENTTADFPTLDALFAISGFTQPAVRALDATDTTCWCLEQCNPEGLCRFRRPAQPARKRKAEASPEPRTHSLGDDNWVQTINLWHPGDFDKTIVEMDSDLPLRAIFKELCSDLRIDRRAVRFVWKRNRRRGGVQSVVLTDTDAPWTVGMQEHNAETVECEYIA
jgi:hypothetical protein